ncbi:MAG: Crp/Fnr family transcriptional regulator [Leptospiraceae bacterium]|nr:Crp/Fnr family transcriptional regulator [Leptospiraceae bacterium]
MKELKDCKTCSSRQNSIFKCVNSSSIELINGEKSFYHFKKKESLFHEEEAAKGFYCIKSGLVRTYKISPNGKEQTFQIEGKGKWVGFRDMISSEVFNHEAVCLEDTEVCFIRKDLVNRLIRTDERFQIEVLKYLASEWKETENHMYSLATKQAYARLAELILTFQKASGDLQEFTLQVTREVMATCIGITTEALIRTLSEFKQKGWLELEKGKIHILNQEAIEDLVNI